MTREAATSAVARRFGNPLLLREQSRDVKLLPWLDSVVRDVRQGIRALGKHGAVTGASVLSLALALGACVAAFSLVDALILRPLPVRQPEQLVYLAFPTDNPERPEGDTFNDPLFVRVRDASREHVALFAMSTQVIRPTIFADSGGEKERLRTQYLSGDAFEQLGCQAGRRPPDRHSRRRPAGRPPGRGPQPRVLASAVRWRSVSRRTLADARGAPARNRRRRRAHVHRRRARPPDRSVAAVHDVQPARIWKPAVRLVSHLRTLEGRRSGRAGTERRCMRPSRASGANTRRGCSGRTRLAGTARTLPQHAALPAARRQRSVTAAAAVRALALDHRRDRGAGPARSPARTSPICFSRGPRHASARWRCACRSAPAASGSSSRCSSKARSSPAPRACSGLLFAEFAGPAVVQMLVVARRSGPARSSHATGGC